MPGHQRHFTSRGSRRRGRCDLGILVGVPQQHLPGVRDLTTGFNLEALAALTASKDDRARWARLPALRLTSPVLTIPTPRVDIAFDTPAPTAPTAVAAETAPPPAPRGGDEAAIADFQRTLLRHLDRHKRYPVAAKAQRAQGVVYIRFSMDRRGRVLATAIEQSSQFVRFDEEGLALLARAQPLPTPPAEMAGDPLELIVPIEFSLR